MFDAQNVEDEGKIIGEDVVMVLRQGKAGNPSWRKDIKQVYIARFCYKTKTNNKENAKNTKEDDDYLFQHNMEHIQRQCISGFQIWKHQTT